MKESVRKVGQRFMVGFDGFEASRDVKRLIREHGVGHVIYFARNIDTPEQVAELSRELQACARDAGHDLPLVIGVDQEGGRVARMGPPWTVWPPLRALGRIGSEDLARRMGEALALECLACGINCDFVPTLDVDTNPENPIIGNRSFGPDPDLVGRLGAAMIRGLEGRRVIGSAKHFPGHGDTDTDSHLELPVIDHPRSRLDAVEIRPFRKAIEAGVATIMMAHVLYTDLDESLPASLSPAVVEGILRKEMKYNGVVLTDDLEMKAVAAQWKPAESAVLAMKAGCDVLPVCSSHDAQVDAMEGAIRALESEELTWASMDVSCARVPRRLDRFLLPHRDPSPKEARQSAGLGEWLALAHEISERGDEPLRHPWTSD
jgi:beta-N-acetylhexosaminidase